MTPKQKDLARRFVACKGWRWMPGMLALDSCNEEHPARVIDGRRSVIYEDNDGAVHEGVVSRSDVPELTDFATLGCILALVRDATGDRRIHCRVRANVYRVYSGVSPVGRWMESEAEALLLALEAA